MYWLHLTGITPNSTSHYHVSHESTVTRQYIPPLVTFRTTPTSTTMYRAVSAHTLGTSFHITQRSTFPCHRTRTNPYCTTTFNNPIPLSLRLRLGTICDPFCYVLLCHISNPNTKMVKNECNFSYSQSARKSNTNLSTDAVNVRKVWVY